jgi:uncharacterized membrane protein YgcG
VAPWWADSYWPRSLRKLPSKNAKSKNGNESFAAAVTEVSERMTALVHDEIELAKAEMAEKAASLARGAAAVAAGAVFGVFAVIFFLLTLAWVIDGIFVTNTGSIWLGFLVVLVVLLVLTVGAFLFAWRKLKVGAPTPKMAIDEAKKIRQTVSSSANGAAATNGNGSSNGHGPIRPETVAAVEVTVTTPYTPVMPPATGGPGETQA